MDTEHSFDSDISESWSVIDINDNEHGNTADLSDGFDTNAIPVTNQGSTSDTVTDGNGEVGLHNGNSGQDISTENFSNNYQNTASPNIEEPIVCQDCQVLYKGKVFQNEYDLRKESSDFNCSKSSFSEAEKIEVDNEIKVPFSDIDDDIECISVISESECNDLKFSAYETDEIWEAKLSEINVLAKAHPSMLKRKRKRLKLNYRESSEESVSSDFMVPDGNYYSNIENIDHKKNDSEMQVTEYPSAPVYRHYRNNVANTVLTLAMGVIFTGVACIAVGHFLGVHDAQHTAGEMMETLKRLQMENVLLHTRMTQLSRAFFSRGSSNLELRANVEPKNCLEKYLEENIHGVNENDQNVGSPIKNSIFFRGGSFDISTNVKEPSNEMNCKKSNDYDKSKILDGNHDQLNYFNISKYEEKYSKVPFSSTSPVKAEYVHNKFSGKNLQDMKYGLDGQMPDRKFLKSSAEYKNCLEADEQFENGRDKQDCLAVREKDLSRFRWFLLQKKKKRKNLRLDEEKSENEDGVYVYKFPQPEGYYKSDKETDERLKLDEMCDEVRVIRYPKGKKPSDARESSKSGVRKNVRFEEKRIKKEKEKREEGSDSEEMEGRESMKKREKRNENPSKKIKDHEDNFSKGSKKYKTEPGKKNSKTKECRKKGDRECNFKPHSKKNKDTTNSKERNRNEKRKDGRDKEKYLKGEKVKKMSMEKEKDPLNKRPRNYRGKKAYDVKPEMKFTNQSDCEHCGGNKTAEWLNKWAKGREKCRRDRKISEWQFDRAKSRAESRIGDAYWQFSRALARESNRNEGYMHFRKRNIKHKGFSSDAYSWI